MLRKRGNQSKLLRRRSVQRILKCILLGRFAALCVEFRVFWKIRMVLMQWGKWRSMSTTSSCFKFRLLFPGLLVKVLSDAWVLVCMLNSFRRVLEAEIKDLSAVTLIYTSELILCSTICVHSATRHNIHIYPYFLFAAIHHLNRPRLSLSDLVAQSTE